MGGNEREFYGEKSFADIRERFGHEGNPMFSSLVITNNIRVALMAFAMGISFRAGHDLGLGRQRRHGWRAGRRVCQERDPVENVDGDPAARRPRIKRYRDCRRGWADRGLRPLGAGQRTRLRALREEVVRAMQLAVGLVPAFALAGLFEGLVTPSDAIPEGRQGHLGHCRCGGILALSAFGRENSHAWALSRSCS